MAVTKKKPNPIRIGVDFSDTPTLYERVSRKLETGTFRIELVDETRLAPGAIYRINATLSRDQLIELQERIVAALARE